MFTRATSLTSRHAKTGVSNAARASRIDSPIAIVVALVLVVLPDRPAAA